MFKNFKVRMNMNSPIAVMDNVILDSIISAAICKEILKDDYYSGSNEAGTKEMQEEMLGKLLDKQYDVYCTSYGIGNNQEFLTNWCKRLDGKHDDYINEKKTKIDIGAGFFKNYHMPLIIKAYKYIDFYVRGDMEKIKEILEKNINYIGKKSAQGYGEIKSYIFIEIEENYSIIKDKMLQRNIPSKYKEELKGKIEMDKTMIMEKSIIPPYWRLDCREECIVPVKL